MRQWNQIRCLALAASTGGDFAAPGDSIVISADKDAIVISADKDAHNPGEKAEQAVKDTGEAKAEMGFNEDGMDDDWNDG